MIHIEGGAFALFNDSVSGEFVKLVPDEKVIQKWRFSHWPKGKICFLNRTHYDAMWTDFYYFLFVMRVFFLFFFFSSIPCHSSWSLSRGYPTHQRTSLVLTLLSSFLLLQMFIPKSHWRSRTLRAKWSFTWNRRASLQGTRKGYSITGARMSLVESAWCLAMVAWVGEKVVTCCACVSMRVVLRGVVRVSPYCF